MLKALITADALSGKERQMNKKPLKEKVIAIATAVMTMTVMCMPAAAFAASNGVEKEETVYVVTDNAGSQQDVIVSDHLINNDEVKTISDETTLSDIENVKGEETFKQNGDGITWDAEGNGIYYQGKSSDEIPVSMDITYRLDDKVVSGPQLQGKSGKVEIKIDYENDATYNGTTVPFVVMTGLIVTDESFKNIKISKGKVIDDGEKLLVVGMAAPGLAQTLGIGESDLGIGSSVTITGDAEEFAVEDMMTVVTNAFFEDIDTDGIDLDYDDEIDALNKGAKALVDGSKQLYDGLTTMNDNMPALENGVNTLKNGADQLNAGTKKAQQGANQLSGGLAQLAKDLPTVLTDLTQNLSQMKQVASGVETNLVKIKFGIDSYIKTLKGVKDKQQNVVAYLTALKAVEGNLTAEQKEKIKDILGSDYESKLDTALADAKEVYGTIDVVANGNGEETTGLAGLSSGLGSEANEDMGSVIWYQHQLDQGLDTMLQTVIAKSSELNTGLTTLTNGAGELKAGEDALATGAQALANGMESLQNKSGTLINGVDQLDKGSLELSKGMSKLYKEGIKKIVDMYNDDLKGTIDNVDGMLDAGKGYKTFTKLPSGMDGNVKFIYKTDITQ